MNAVHLVAALLLVSLTLGAGLQVERDHLLESLKNIGLLGRALLANVVIVPVLGVLLVRLFRLPEHVATGVLLMAIAPGVPFVLASVRKRGGRLGFAVELAFILPLISVITVPITALLVFPGSHAQIPFLRFFTTLVLFQLVPLIAGVLIAGRWPALAARMGRPLQVIFFGSALVLIALLGATLVHAVTIVYGSNGMWAILVLTIAATFTGWLLGGPHQEDRRVLAIGTALRNIGLCALVATATIRNPEVTATVLIYLVIQLIVTTLTGIYFTRTAARDTA